jgi:hypothetical protein
MSISISRLCLVFCLFPALIAAAREGKESDADIRLFLSLDCQLAVIEDVFSVVWMSLRSEPSILSSSSVPSLV